MIQSTLQMSRSRREERLGDGVVVSAIAKRLQYHLRNQQTADSQEPTADSHDEPDGDDVDADSIHSCVDEVQQYQQHHQLSRQVVSLGLLNGSVAVHLH